MTRVLYFDTVIYISLYGLWVFFFFESCFRNPSLAWAHADLFRGLNEARPDFLAFALSLLCHFPYLSWMYLCRAECKLQHSLQRWSQSRQPGQTGWAEPGVGAESFFMTQWLFCTAAVVQGWLALSETWLICRLDKLVTKLSWLSSFAFSSLPASYFLPLLSIDTEKTEGAWGQIHTQACRVGHPWRGPCVGGEREWL